MKSVFISSGEVSGDHYGSAIASHLRELDPSVKIYGIGGKKMKEAGVNLLINIRDIEAIGFIEVLNKLPKLLKAIKKTVSFLKNNKIDIFIPVDNPGFNFRVIKGIRKSPIRVFYFIPPQIWAWRTKRVYFLKKNSHKIGVIFPFEKQFYSRFGIDPVYAGHPLAERYIGNKPDLESLQDKFTKINSNEIPLNLALLPGSRESEIISLLPIMLNTHNLLKRHYPGMRSHIPISPNVNPDLIKGFIRDESKDEILLYDDVDEVFGICDFAVIASGTATLQASLYPIPFIIVYRLQRFSYYIAKFFARLKYIGITNIILDDYVIPEFIQEDAKPDILSEEISGFLSHYEKIMTMMNSFIKLRKMLYNENSIASITAEIYKMFPETQYKI